MLIYNKAPVLGPSGQPLEGTDRIISDHKMWFTNRSPNTGDRRINVPAEVIGLHWTGGERGGAGIFRTLEKRRLSIHFTIDIDGTITQHADLNLYCAHIGSRHDRPYSLNLRSIGIEMTSRGFASKKDLRGLGLRERTQLDWEAPRDVYRSVIGGRKVNTVSYYYPQHIAMLWLVETISGVLNIPRRIPMVEVGINDTTPRWLADMGVEPVTDPDSGRIYLPSFERDYRHKKGLRSTFQGTLGHFHVHKTKYDPGAQPFASLWMEGFNPAGYKVPFDQQPGFGTGGA